jgi:hypothetical protein
MLDGTGSGFSPLCTITGIKPLESFTVGVNVVMQSNDCSFIQLFL